MVKRLPLLMGMVGCAVAAPGRAQDAASAPSEVQAAPQPDAQTAPQLLPDAASTLPGDDTVTTSLPATEARTPAEVRSETAPVGTFTLDSPITTLLADPHAKAVIDRDVPGLSGDENLPKFEALSMRAFQPLTGGQLTDEMLTQIGQDLAAIPPADGSPPPRQRRVGTDTGR